MVPINEEKRPNLKLVAPKLILRGSRLGSYKQSKSTQSHGTYAVFVTPILRSKCGFCVAMVVRFVGTIGHSLLPASSQSPYTHGGQPR